MHEFAVLNNQIVSAENTFLDAASPAAFYGRGIFTTVAIYNSQPFLWAKHWRRITENVGKIGIDLTNFPQKKIVDSLGEIVAANKIIDARARITFFDESSISIWRTEQKTRTRFLINTADFRKSPEQFRLTVSPFRSNSTSPLSGVKSCNYLENILALEQAKARGFDEAVRLNERGEIVSACMANIFWLKNSEIFTPSLETGCLAGTTREFVLENYPVCEKKAKLNELAEADSIFLTSAGIEIVQAAEFQEKKLSGNLHDVMRIYPSMTLGKMNSKPLN